ncbi:MAG: hypothetical protein ABI380_15310 [Edaphobacter sp.]
MEPQSKKLRSRDHNVVVGTEMYSITALRSGKNLGSLVAVERKNMRFVPIKTDDQLDLQAIHRVRVSA